MEIFGGKRGGGIRLWMVGWCGGMGGGMGGGWKNGGFFWFFTGVAVDLEIKGAYRRLKEGYFRSEGRCKEAYRRWKGSKKDPIQ
jgi:hypothetical protein